MLTEIENLIAAIAETEVESALVTSKALRLADGIVAAGVGRVDTNVVAFYEFKTLTGTTAFDTSGVEPAMNLSFNGDVSWVAPSNFTQEEARIVSYSGGENERNFALTQTLYNYNYNYDFPARSSLTDGNGNPEISTPDGDEVLQATLQHVVATFDPTNGRQLFVNGIRIEVDDEDEDGGTLNHWDDTYAFVLGNEVSSDRLWRGVLRKVAIHNRALTAEQVRLNFDTGVGEQFYLLFGVSHLIDVPDAFVVFQLSQFDSYSYLFNSPFFVSLSDSSTPDNIPLQGMRISINGREPEVGQAYRHLDLMLDESRYEPGIGQRISSIGTILGIEKGVESDEFFLTFERLGDNANLVVEATPSPEAQAPDTGPAPQIGVKTFDEINASMSVITTVPTSHPDVFSTFSNVRQQLPSLPGIDGFLFSQQIINTDLGLAFHSDSAYLRGMLEKLGPGTAAAINGAVLPARSENDTGNNPHNPMYVINRGGADGSLLTLIGSRSSDSGGNSMSASDLIDPGVGPTKVDRSSDVTGLVNVGDLVNLLSQQDTVAVRESIQRISDLKLNNVSSGKQRQS